MPNRSLDDFAGGDEEETDASDPEAEADTSDTEAERPDVAAGETESVTSDPTSETAETDDSADDETEEPTLTVQEATPTYDFSPDGATCEACGETVQTRWHADEVGMVCADCKGWE